MTITPTSGVDLQIDSNFSGILTTINNRTYNLGLTFTDGIAPPEVKKYAGNIVFMLTIDLLLQGQLTKKKISKLFCSSKELCLSRQIFNVAPYFDDFDPSK